MKQKTSAALFLLLMGFCGVAAAAKLTKITVENRAQQATVRITTTALSLRRQFILHNPDRLVVDLNQTQSVVSLKSVVLSAGLVSNLRLGYPDAKTLRLVFDLKAPAVLTVTAHGPVLTLELRSKLIARQQQAVPKALRDVVVVIDPGHGGHDPGAMGARRSTEKQLVLAIAKRLKQRIDQQPGMRAVLTRDGDYYLGLRQRMSIARHHNADLFVAIHADAFGNRNSNGASVFALSQTGATSEAARWLAEKENYSELGGVNLSALDDQNGVIRSVLIDLSQTATIGASLQMGQQVLMRMNRVTRLHSPRVEQARFMVLKSPDIPSVLIETGFISNPREERNLSNPVYQARLSQAIFEGLKGYFWAFPPAGSRVEAMALGQRRLASAGR